MCSANCLTSSYLIFLSEVLVQHRTLSVFFFFFTIKSTNIISSSFFFFVSINSCFALSLLFFLPCFAYIILLFFHFCSFLASIQPPISLCSPYSRSVFVTLLPFQICYLCLSPSRPSSYNFLSLYFSFTLFIFSGFLLPPVSCFFFLISFTYFHYVSFFPVFSLHTFLLLSLSFFSVFFPILSLVLTWLYLKGLPKVISRSGCKFQV